jgi:hypothetical protein
MPFDLEKEVYENLFSACEESTNEINFSNHNQSSNKLDYKFPMSPFNSDIDEIINNEDKLDKFMQDLESIDQPLTQRRLRAKKGTESPNSLSGSSSTTKFSV